MYDFFSLSRLLSYFIMVDSKVKYLWGKYCYFSVYPFPLIITCFSLHLYWCDCVHIINMSSFCVCVLCMQCIVCNVHRKTLQNYTKEINLYSLSKLAASCSSKIIRYFLLFVSHNFPFMINIWINSIKIIREWEKQKKNTISV